MFRPADWVKTPEGNMSQEDAVIKGLFVVKKVWNVCEGKINRGGHYATKELAESATYSDRQCVKLFYILENTQDEKWLGYLSQTHAKKLFTLTA